MVSNISRLIILYKGPKGATSLPTNALVSPGSIIPLHFHPHWLRLTFTSPVSSLRQLEVAIPNQSLFMLLSVQRIRLLVGASD